MKLVPQRSILLVATIMLILFLVVINVGASLFEKNQDPITMNPDNNASLTGDNNVTVEGLRAVQDSATINIVTYLDLLAVIGCVVFIFIANLSYLYVINNSEVIQLVETSLKLAGFSIKINRFGRVWEIFENATLILHGGSHPFFHLDYRPYNPKVDPRMYGLTVSNDHISQNIGVESLQLTMQSFHRFLVTEAEIK